LAIVPAKVEALAKAIFASFERAPKLIAPNTIGVSISIGFFDCFPIIVFEEIFSLK